MATESAESEQPVKPIRESSMIKSEQREIEDRKVYLGHQVVQLMGSVGTLFQVPAIESMPFVCVVVSLRGGGVCDRKNWN